MLKLETSKMTKAIAKAKTIHPTVKQVAPGRYHVSSSDKQHAYYVILGKANGLYLGECNCKAGRAGQVCFHIAAACSLHVGIKRGYSKEATAPRRESGYPNKKAKMRAAADAALMREQAILVKREGNAMRIDNNPILV